MRSFICTSMPLPDSTSFHGTVETGVARTQETITLPGYLVSLRNICIHQFVPEFTAVLKVATTKLPFSFEFRRIGTSLMCIRTKKKDEHIPNPLPPPDCLPGVDPTSLGP